MSDFSGLRLALTALQAQQRGVEVSAQNVANANTEGYSRQRVDLVNIGAPAVPALFSRYDGAGGGVRVDDIVRFRDQFLEIRAAVEHGAMSHAGESAQTMQRVQDLFHEPTDAGIAQQLSDFWSAFDDVANHPEDMASRTQLLERATTLTSAFNSTSDALTQIADDTTQELRANVADINSMATSLAQMNGAIKANFIAGLPVNDLLDQRDKLAIKLAEASGATIRQGEFKQVNLAVGGNLLVQDNHAAALTLDTSSGAVLRWSNNNAVADVTSGKAGAQLTTINATIPSYISSLDTVATTLRDDVNALHGSITGSIPAASQDQSATSTLSFDVALNGGPYATVSITGADWSGAGGDTALQSSLQTALDTALGGPGLATVNVTGGNGTPLDVSIVPAGTNTLTVRDSGVDTGFSTLLGTTAIGSDGVGGRAFFSGDTAKTLGLSTDVANTPSAVAAGTAAGGPLDGSRALDLADLANSLTGSDASYRQLIVQLGVDTQTANSRNTIQQKATQSIDNSRMQQSGVSIDEEMTNLVAYQHAYEAAAHFMSVIDSMLDTLINHTG